MGNRRIARLKVRPFISWFVWTGLVWGGTDAPTFDKDIQPILTKKCLPCHAGKAPQAGLDLRSPATILKGGKSGPAIVTGSSGSSLLMEKIVSRTMPPGDIKLTDQEIEQIQVWIDKGTARSDAGADAKVVNAAVTEQEVLPIFQVRCGVCHGKRKQEGGLDLRTREAGLKGGKSGPALVPGKPDDSLLLQRIKSGEMPPPNLTLLFENSVRPPTDAEIEKLRRWIAAGAPPTPKRKADSLHSDAPVRAEDRKFWSFLPPVRPPAPRVRAEHLVRNPVDAFLLGKLEAKNLTYSPQAGRLKLMRRAYIDLIGMLPSPAEIKEYLNDARVDAYERLIDRLLASPHYGERWGRYWLDLAGYSDSEDFGAHDPVRPYAWRYRDYVIRSFNSDRPYSQFLTEQIAGDELADYSQAKVVTQDLIDRLAATGFLRTTPDTTFLPDQAFITERVKVIADTIEVLTSSVLGLTVGCARCHDHKYDPIPQRDYYRFSAILQTAYDPYDWLPPKKRQVEIGLEDEIRESAAHNGPIEREIKKLEEALEKLQKPYREKLLVERLAALPEGVSTDLRAIPAVPDDKRSALQRYLAEKFHDVLKIGTADLIGKYSDLRTKAEPLQKEIVAAENKLWPKPHVRVLFDTGGKPSTAYLLRRGDPMTPGEPVEPGVPSVLDAGLEPYRIAPPWPGAESSGRRLALARWITQPNHPLTSRVMVNQIWMRHFGRGLVASPSNFGRSGVQPSHPELLDWLATEFVGAGWSVKSMHRLIMTSTAYRQSSSVAADALRGDPENVLLSRMPLRRMDAEALYDSVLKASGRLDPAQFGPPEELRIMPDKEVVPKGSKKGFRRSIYMQQRGQIPPSLHEVFDLPRMTPNCVERRESTVATQALQMMNGSVVWDHARFMAGRIIDDTGEDQQSQVEQVYLRALSRPPSAGELREGLAAMAEFGKLWPARLEQDGETAPRGGTARWLALTNFCHAILNSSEFVYVD